MNAVSDGEVTSVNMTLSLTLGDPATLATDSGSSSSLPATNTCRLIRGWCYKNVTAGVDKCSPSRKKESFKMYIQVFHTQRSSLFDYTQAHYVSLACAQSWQFNVDSATTSEQNDGTATKGIH